MAVVDRAGNRAVTVDLVLWFAAVSTAGGIDRHPAGSRGRLDHLGISQTTSKGCRIAWISLCNLCVPLWL